jgi:hypothetical protein
MANRSISYICMTLTLYSVFTIQFIDEIFKRIITAFIIYIINISSTYHKTTNAGRSCRIWGSHSGGMRSPIFCNTTQCSPLKVNRHFRGTCDLHFQGRKISQARNQQWSTCCLLHAGFLLGLFLDRWRLHVPPKRQLTFNGLHRVTSISQKTGLLNDRFCSKLPFTCNRRAPEIQNLVWRL